MLKVFKQMHAEMDAISRARGGVNRLDLVNRASLASRIPYVSMEISLNAPQLYEDLALALAKLWDRAIALVHDSPHPLTWASADMVLSVARGPRYTIDTDFDALDLFVYDGALSAVMDVARYSSAPDASAIEDDVRRIYDLMASQPTVSLLSPLDRNGNVIE